MDPNDLVSTYDLLVAGGATPEAAATRMRQMAPTLSTEIDAIWADFESRAGIIRFADDPAAIVARTSIGVPWYTGPKTDDRFWPAVRSRLAETLNDEAIDAVDGASSKVLALLHAPGQSTFSTRGLVLGNVQSGKTTSFISVLSKAADRGFRMFIVLSGITDNLRTQTQDRVDELLLGPEGEGWYRLTQGDSDFNESPANAVALLGSHLKLIAVVKKNPARLRRLRNWLNAAGSGALSMTPIVVIDDEADQASIDVGKHRTSVINGLLREILARPKAAYVAYTATPFANLLIDPHKKDDLYPRDFVVALPQSGEYFGAERIFGRTERLGEDDELDDGLDIVRSIDPTEASHARPPSKAILSWQPSIEPALEDGIRWFLLATAARRARGGGNKHSTMLVHTSMLATAHERMAEAIEECLEDLTNRLSGRDAALLDELKSLYEAEIKRVPAGQFGRSEVSFDDVEVQLIDSLVETRVIVDNYKSSDRLAYPKSEPSATIVVGGNTLSRGLTLEGLCSSYFVRSASTYDTLLQMGRWFGYRTGYEDLCRIWMTDDLAGWFRDLSLVETEIRNEIRRYEYEGMTPEQVGIRIRTHPAMAITAAIKMRDAEDAQMTYSDARPQTILFRRTDRRWLEANITAAKDFASAVGRVHPETIVRGRPAYLGVDVGAILKFLSEYSFHENSQSVRAELLRNYVASERRAGALEQWNVVFMSGFDDAGIELGLSRRLALLNRSRLETLDGDVANMKAIVSTPDRVADIDEPRLSEKLGRSALPRTDLDLQKLREQIYPATPVLAIYPIAARSKARIGANYKGSPRRDLEAATDVIGVAIFFPTARNAQSLVSYKTANVVERTYETVDEELAQIEFADEFDEIQADAADALNSPTSGS